MAKQSDLRKRMNQLGKVYSKQTEIKRYQQALRNADYEDTERRRKNREAIKLSRQVQKQIGKSKAGRALMGFVYGFNTGLAPASYSKKAADLGYKAYTPSAAAAERGDTTKKTAAFNKSLESSGAFKKAQTAGNMASTALAFITGSGATKAIGSKMLKTGVAKSMAKTTASNLSQMALRDSARKGLLRKVLERSAQNAGRKVTDNAIKSAASKLTGRVAENVAQDVAGDMTIGLYRDLAQARSQGVDIKNAKQLAPYLLQQAGMNTLIGGVTNAAGPALGAMSRNKAMWKTVEDNVTDAAGRTHVRYKKVLKNPAKGATAVDQFGEAIDIVSPKVRASSKQQKILRNVDGETKALSPVDLNRKAATDAVNNKWYVNDVRKNGINGKSVRQLADEQHRSVIDIIGEDYQTRYARTLESNRAYAKSKLKPRTTRDVTAELSSAELGTRAINRGGLRSAYDTSNPFNAKYKVRNAQGRLVAHRATEGDVMRANFMAVNGAPNIIASRRAALRARAGADDIVEGTAARAGRFSSEYVPTHDIADPRLAKQLSDAKVQKAFKREYGQEVLEYAQENNLEPSAVLMMMRDKMAERLGARTLTEAEQAAYRNVKDEVTEQAMKQAGLKPDEATIRNVTSNTEVPPQTVTRATSNTVPEPNVKPAPEQPQNVATPGGATVDIEGVNGQTGRAAAEAEASTVPPDTTGAPDVTMGGRRSGQAAQRSQAADSVAGMAGNTPEEVKEINDYLNQIGADKTFRQSNADAIKEAAGRIERDTVDGSRAALRQKFDGNARFDNVDIAEGFTLMNRYREMARAARDSGNTDLAKQYMKSYNEVAGIIDVEGSELGKGLQAMSLFRKMTPDGRVNAVMMMKEKIAKQTGVDDLEVDQNLLDMLYDAKRVEDQQAIQDAIRTQIWDQVPSTLTEKASAWRYLSMLGNPKTHIRNIFGNTVFVPTRGIRNIIASGIEKLDPRLKSGDYTKAILNPLSRSDKDLIGYGLNEWNSVRRSFLESTQKYDVGLRRPEGSRVFKNRVLNAASDINSNLLNKEDEVFAKLAYSHAYAQYMKANKINVKNASEEVLEKARKYAWDEALEATYREQNALADIINKWRKNANISMRDIRNASGSAREKLVMKKVGGTMVDAMIPFAKTPANIMRAGVRYSPVGLMNGVRKMFTASNPQEVMKAIDSVSAGMTGTGMFALGMLFAKNKWANASIDKDDQGYYDFDRGKQEYAINIGNETLKKADWFDLLNAERGNDASVSMDWAVPDAMSFFSGVELGSQMFFASEDEDITDKATRAGKIFTNMLKMSDPVLEMSMLSSLKNAFDTSKADENGNSALLQLGTNVVQSRLGQYVPTVLGQITKSTVENQKSSSSTQTGALKSWDSFLKQQENKIPGLTKLNPDKTDAFGRTKEHKENVKNYIQAFLKNAVSPANIKQVRNTGVDKELQRLVTDEGVAPDDVLPRTAYKGMMDQKFGDLKFKIGAHEVEQFNKWRGNKAMDGLKKLFKSDNYKGASVEEKQRLIKDVYDNATEYAQKKFAMDQGVSEYDYYYKTMSDSAKERYDQKLKDLKAAGSKLSKEQYMKIYNKMGEYYGRDDNKYGNNTYVARTLDAIKLGVKKFDEAKVASNADKYGTTWTKAVNLYNRGVTAKQAYKYAMTEDERLKCCNTNKYGNNVLDRNKLALYINQMKIPQSEKWARFEVNRTKSMSNPF